MKYLQIHYFKIFIFCKELKTHRIFNIGADVENIAVIKTIDRI